jgi:hypothetical protein
LETYLDFSLNIFKSTFIHSTQLSASGPLGMVFEHLWDLFDPKDSTSGFSQLILVCFYVDVRHILGSIAKALSAMRLLTLAKPFGGIQPIVVGKVLY